MFLAAVAQLTCTSDAEANFNQARVLIERAARAGAALVVTPENTNYLGPHAEKVRLAEPLDGPTVQRFSALARDHGLHVLMGSFNEASDDPDRCYNTSVLLGPDGAVIASYRKVHLFDVDLNAEVCFKESDTVVAGTALTVAETSLGTIGMSICYDLRFPGLYQSLTERGASMLTVPSAFTMRTGKDHWEPLLRARAIENQAWVLAANQSGHHDDAGLRESFGQSMIIDPWGRVVARASDGPGLAFAEVDLARVDATRRSMPVASHRVF